MLSGPTELLLGGHEGARFLAQVAAASKGSKGETVVAGLMYNQSCMAALARLVATVALVAVPEVSAADEASAPAEVKPVAAPPPAERGPAEDLVLEGSIGYGAGPFTTIAGRKPLVAHGPMFHLGLGWAWSIRSNQSLGLEVTADGMFDGERTTTDVEAGRSGTGAVGGRYGAAAFVIGEKAHVRVGSGWASSTYQDAKYQGLSVNFAAGWHVPIIPSAKSWKRPAVTFDIASSWDFLGAGDETLHRWTIGLLIGMAIY